MKSNSQRVMRTTGGSPDVSTCYCTFVSPDLAAQSHTKPGKTNLCLHTFVFMYFNLISAQFCKILDAIQYCRLIARRLCFAGQRQKAGLEVLPAHNGSAMVARLPSSGHKSIQEVPRVNTFLEEAAALLSLSTLFG